MISVLFPVLFCLPFISLGLFVLAMGVGKLSAPQPDFAQVAMLGCTGFLFLLAGGGLLVGIYFGAREKKRSEERKQQYPEMPWVWRSEWSEGNIESHSRVKLTVTWIIALIVAMISAPCAIYVPKEAASGNSLAWLGMVFPLAAVGFFYHATRLTLERIKFGKQVFIIDGGTGALGGLISGTIKLQKRFPSLNTAELTLSWIQRHRSSESTWETIHWQEKAKVRAVHNDVTSIPVSFALPSDGSPSSNEDPLSETLWMLSVHSEVDGINLRSEYEVPVFAVPEHAVISRVRPSIETNEVAHIPEGIKLASTSGGVRIQFSKARCQKAGAVSGFYTLLLGGACYLTFTIGVPMIFWGVTGLLFLIFALITVTLWLERREIEVGTNGLNYRSGIVSLATRHHFNNNEIKDIKLSIGMQVGREPYYNFSVQTIFGRSISLQVQISDKKAAEHVLGIMRNLLKLAEKTTELGVAHPPR